MRWLCLLLWCLPSGGFALDWAVLGPVPSPEPAALSAAAQSWLSGEADRPVAGLDGTRRWSLPHPDPVDIRALAEAPAGGTFYARAIFESDHAGALAVRVRCDAAIRVWLDGRLIGGRARATRWTDAPLALPAAVEKGAHRLLVEIRPPHARSAVLAVALTTPDGTLIEWRRQNGAAPRPAVTPEAPVALRRTRLPSTQLPARRWTPKAAVSDPIQLPDLPANWQARPRWPDADWVILADAVRWRLDTRQAARRTAFRVNAPHAIEAARAFAGRFERLVDARTRRPIRSTDIEVGTLVIGERRSALPPDPLKLGAARLPPIAAPTWSLTVEIDAPRGWTLARASEGRGGARQADIDAGRRQWRYTAEAVSTGALRVSRVEGLDAFTQHVQAAIRDHLRPFPNAPDCLAFKTGLQAALRCARTGKSLFFGQFGGRPRPTGPIDLADFDVIGAGTPPDRVAWATFVGGGRHVRGRPAQLRYTLNPHRPNLPAIPLGGPCASSGRYASTGHVEAWVEAELTGVSRTLPPSRTQRRHGMRLTRQYQRAPSGWRAHYQLRWADLSRVAPARIAATCAQWGLR